MKKTCKKYCPLSYDARQHVTLWTMMSALVNPLPFLEQINHIIDSKKLFIYSDISRIHCGYEIEVFERICKKTRQDR